MAITVNWGLTCTVTETLAGNTGSLDDTSLAKTLVHTAFNESGTLTADTTPPVSKHGQFLLTLTSGAYTINLAALPSTNGALVDGTGLKLQIIRIKNLGAASMTFAEGSANGYAIGSIIVPAGAVVQCVFNDNQPDIASGDRTIDVAGTGAQTAEVSIVMG